MPSKELVRKITPAVSLGGTGVGLVGFIWFIAALAVGASPVIPFVMLFALFSLPGGVLLSRSLETKPAPKELTTEVKVDDRYSLVKRRIKAGERVNDGGILSEDQDYTCFSPFAECPKCHLEGYHALRPAKGEADLDSKDIQEKAIRISKREGMVPPKRDVITLEMRQNMTDEQIKLADEKYAELVADVMVECRRMAVGYLLAPEQGFDVIRTCDGDKCKHTWGQKMGSWA